MRILFDIQGAQNDNRWRGIGRYVLSLAKAMAANPKGHDIEFLMSTAFPDTIAPIRLAIERASGPQRFRVFDPFTGTAAISADGGWRRRASELIRSAAVAAARVDCVLMGSVFDGFTDDTALTLHDDGPGLPTAVILYDLIPLAWPDRYLKAENAARWYGERLNQFRRADAFLAISDYSRTDAIARLGLPPENCSTIGAAADHDIAIELSEAQITQALQQYGVTRDFIMYAGGVDWRKNIDGLVDAYCGLPASLRARFQLAIVSDIEAEAEQRLHAQATARGAAPGDLVFTGYVPDDVLAAFYRSTTLFVMPSHCEGFGLPPLEAMASGAATIAADNSSLPEVIGLRDALFSLDMPNGMHDAIARALTDDAYRKKLQTHGLKQAAKYSWRKTAERTFEALEAMAGRHAQTRSAPVAARPKLAFLSPMPPTRSGISDYSAELLPELARYYDIDLVTETPVAAGVAAGAWSRAIDPEAFAHVAARYDRILYHFGNSPFHRHMFDLLEKHPGVVVLHDFFLPWPYIDEGRRPGRPPEPLTRALFASGGYRALADWRTRPPGEIAQEEPCNVAVMQNALGIITHSQHAVDLARRHYGVIDERHFTVAPLLRAPAFKRNRATARAALGIEADAFIVASFGMIGSPKRNHELADAWRRAQVASQPKSMLVFAGANDAGPYGEALNARIADMAPERRARVTGWLDADLYRLWLAAADVGVQLRANSRGETSAAALDCFNYELATIVNACGSMAELTDDAAVILPEEANAAAIAAAIDQLAADTALRQRYGAAGRELIETRHSPKRCAALYRDAIETFYDCASGSARSGARQLALTTHARLSDYASFADKAARSAPPLVRHPQVVIDVSSIMDHDLGTGIQRVVRNIARRWMEKGPAPWRVDLAHASNGDVYRYARTHALKWLQLDGPGIDDDALDLAPGDIILLLDSAWHVHASQATYYKRLRAIGCRVIFVVYDILPVIRPQYFPEFAVKLFGEMMSSLSESDGAMCISQSVANELRDWMATHAEHRADDFLIDWFHLGADLDTGDKQPLAALPDALAANPNPSLLMVGTVEPRKGHAQTLAAFEMLWAEGVDANLVIVGKFGWAIERVAERIRMHPEFNRRLFCFEKADDDLLAALYDTADCLIAASEAEGFGLPLIEAARKKIPVIARDIPVFREVAGSGAHYFSGERAEDMAKAIRDWLDLFRRGAHPKPDDIKVMTWDESAEQLWTRMHDLASRTSAGEARRRNSAN